MPLRVVVDAGNGVPPWRQVHDQIVRAITTGSLARDARLPPIRQLSRDLGLASGTVARVYRELEATGWVTTARARGTVVTGPVERPDPGAMLRNAAAEYARYSRELGVAPDEAVDAVRVALASLDAPSQ
ncbi:GntR family transcriptional regulator [Amycolatopsis rubida]|uniref:GntR family transcriptional regulator n=1 Tax=Amycolatopsis rubida TaxID=112413 RepID=A0ABX0C1H1_9PSEU|nr:MULTISPECIES: GntR family transcriptional regulator [Amycolatopsis]MYW96672.1 GntR family transcriptional regulator [Amycolatopsis rubida]NEC61657.1 GntR family transcriptional regulator [Amycolatopsis rubida]OAP24757.1 HTH-type transcriptional repressor YtrA [Amycolatopsis sp. M39]